MTAHDPLPVDPNATPDNQRHQALTYADAQGWLTFHHVTPGKPSARRWVITTVNGVRRSMYPGEVLPYVTGYADALRHGALFPPREDTPGR